MSPEELCGRAVAACSNPCVTAWRVVGELEPDLGQGAPIAPPLYGDENPRVNRVRADGQREATVVLDSIPSQANRAEAALALAVAEGRLDLPLLELVVGDGPAEQVVTSLQAPHRCADAVWRDALLDGVPFYGSEVGASIRLASVGNAAALWRWYPTALLYGWYFSRPEDYKYLGRKDPALQRAIQLNTGPRRVAVGPRAWISEIVGIDPEVNVVTASRIDPLQIGALEVYRTEDDLWTANPEAARREPAKKGAAAPGRPVPYGKKSAASAVGHSNVPPRVRPGRVTVRAIEARGVLQLPLLRRYRFAVDGAPVAADVAAHARAALALLAVVAHELAAQDLVLRSGCGLVATRWRWEEVAADGTGQELPVELDTALAALGLALEQAAVLGGWDERLVLQPSAALADLVARSLERESDEAVEEEG